MPKISASGLKVILVPVVLAGAGPMSWSFDVAYPRANSILRSIESRVDPRRFVRIHRRRLVALDAMKELQPWFAGDQVMILRDGTKLRVSRSYRESLARQLAGEG